ncbi:MAG: hypothetical protein Tsb009_22330 [Planctomycetaceae bacterium]
MAGFRLELPTIQNWSCHNCSGCCRQHAIEITETERERIIAQGWTEEDGIASETPVVVPFGGFPWQKRYRLGHRSDGSCVFLNEDGLCRIHAKFGEAAKPLACRIYPFTFHPAGGRLTVSLRFSCPSVVANRGKPVPERRGELRKIAKLALPESADEAEPPRISKKQSVSWQDFHRFLEKLDDSLADSGKPFLHRLLDTLQWLEIVGESRFETVKDARLVEFLNLIVPQSTGNGPEESLEQEPPSKIGFTQLRMLVAQYARKDTFKEMQEGWRGRWKLLTAAIRFARGKGSIPVLREGFRDVPFAEIEQDFGPLPEGSEELFERYFRVKVQGIHFCGLAYYGIPFVEGFQSLALIYPVVIWIARWLALSNDRHALMIEDIQTALSIADHHHGFSPAFGRNSFRKRVRLLAETGDLSKLCVHYGIGKARD